MNGGNGMRVGKFDAFVVGAGLSGAVLAERMASVLGYRVLVIDQRSHVAGNCHDEHDEHGVLVHRYGPHLFHTDKPEVWEYLSRFTEWHPYEHRVLASVDGELLPVPFNLTSIERSFPEAEAQAIIAALHERFGEGARVPILKLRAEDNPLLRKLADFVYEKVFVHYTTKQWGVKPEEISPEVTARVPVVVTRDDRYFSDPYQAVPKHGYTKMVEAMLRHPNIEVKLGVAFGEVATFDAATGAVTLDGVPFEGLTVFTGMIDELFAYVHGDLPYRSLRFEFAHHGDKEAFQPATTVNYPNEHAYTRITEFKHMTGQACEGTTVVYEYPHAFDRHQNHTPYYPIFNESSQAAYGRYAAKTKEMPKIVLAGRLAQYRYFDMDDAVENALIAFRGLRARTVTAVTP
jgi:UDP-galactopyranose mutase